MIQDEKMAQDALGNLKWALHDIQQAAACCKRLGMNTKDLDSAFRTIANKRSEIFKMLEANEEVTSKDEFEGKEG